MTARIIPVDFKANRARLIAQAKGERIRELAEELGAYAAGEPRSYMAGYYEAMGWADAHELLLAVDTLREEGR
jgi:hypothetical protein